MTARSARYVALIRGINVGGRNKVQMVALRQAVEAGGYGAVRTYIQSGNVLFESPYSRSRAEEDLERVLDRQLSVATIVVVRSLADLRNVVAKAPEGFGSSPDKFHSDVMFLKSPLTAAEAIKLVERREGVDQAWAGSGVIYFSRLSAERTKSRMSRITATPAYRQMTIRSWSTTVKLLDLLEQPTG